MSEPDPEPEGTAWIDDLSDDECVEIFWLYVDGSDAFLKTYSPELLGSAMRYALRVVAEGSS